MSLATRCPHCKTIFHVSEEQLRMRAGVVRCGVCRKLFNGIDNLAGRIPTGSKAGDSGPTVDTENRLPLPGQTVSLPSAEALKKSFDRQLQSLSLDLEIDNAAAEQMPSHDTDSVPETHLHKPSDDEEQPSSPSDTIMSSGLPLPAASPPQAAYPASDSDISSHDKSSADDLFDAIHRKKRRSRMAGIFWLAGTIVLAIVLCGQIVYHYGSHIVTWWPPAKGLVGSVCEMLSCPSGNTTVPDNPWHIEYGEPVPTENTPDRFTQSVTLFHLRESPQPWPALLVEITDSENRVLSRKIIEPDEYLAESYRHLATWPAREKNHILLFIEQPQDTVIHSRIVPFNH